MPRHEVRIGADMKTVRMRAYFTVPVNLDLPNDYPALGGDGKFYAIRNRYSVELPPGMEDGEGYIQQLANAGELWRLAVYEDTYDSDGDDLERPVLPDLRDIVAYEGSCSHSQTELNKKES